ncbi:Breast cancer 2, early onset [Geranomyces variabilis]|uniref:Breast cancer 2, early onset n=1 Tax=Geranomyces variabilis TaxID=109894 RepID=A0AAD5TDD1_9FUNG|nr:Breast cancer 2, early onset [Geranomyces variabilis]
MRGAQLEFRAAHEDPATLPIVNDSETEDEGVAEDDMAAVTLALKPHEQREVDDRPDELLDPLSNTDVAAVHAHDGLVENEAEKDESPYILVSCPALSPLPPVAAAADIDVLAIADPEDKSIDLSPPPDRGNNDVPLMPTADELRLPKPTSHSTSSISSSPTERVSAKGVPVPFTPNHADSLEDALLDDTNILSQPSQTLMDAPPSAPNPAIDNFVDFGDDEDEGDEYGGDIPASFLATIHSMTQDYRRNENSSVSDPSPEDVDGHLKSSQEYYHDDDEITCSFLEGVDQHTSLAHRAQNPAVLGRAPGFVAASGRKIEVAPESLDAIRALAEDDFREAPKVSFVPQSLADLRISSSQRARSRDLTSSQMSAKANRLESFPRSSIVAGPKASEVAPPPRVAGDMQSSAAAARTEAETAEEREFAHASPSLSGKMKQIAVSIVESPHVATCHARAAEPYTENPSPKRARYMTADVEFDRPGHLLPETPHPQQEPPSLADSAIPFSRFADRLNGSTPITPARARPPDTGFMLGTPIKRGTSTLGGFSTGTGKRLPIISEKAQLYAKQLGFENRAFNLNPETLTEEPGTPQRPCTPLPMSTSEPPDILDILFNPDPVTPNVKSAPSLTGFSTGAGKALPLTSAKARAHARVLGFDDDGLDGIAAETPVPKPFNRSADPSTRPQAVATFETPISKPAMSPFVGFASGSGKRLAPVSERAHAHVRSLGIVDPVPAQQSADSRQSSSLIGETPTRRPSNAFQTPVGKPPVPAAFEGFALGNGKELPPISQQAHAHAQLLRFDEDEAVPAQPRRRLSNAFETPVSKPPSEFKGFASGNGKQLPPVSDKARAHLKLRGLDDDEEVPSDSHSSNAFETPESKPPSKFQGFAPGNGKQLPPVSAKARAHLKQLGLDDDDAMRSELRHPSNAFETPVSKPPSGFQGFASGNGKQLPPVSENARAHLKQLGLDDDDAMPSELRHPSNAFETPVSKPPSGFQGFASGNGKQLPPVSEKTRAHLKQLGLDDDDASCPRTPASPVDNMRSKDVAPKLSSPSTLMPDKGLAREEDESANKENEAVSEANGIEPSIGGNAKSSTPMPLGVRRPAETPNARKSVAVPKHTPFNKNGATVGPHGKVFALPGPPTTTSPSPHAQTPVRRSSSFSSPMSTQKKMFKPLNICLKLEALQGPGRTGHSPMGQAREITQPTKMHVPLCDLSARPQRPLVNSKNRHIQSLGNHQDINQDIPGIAAANAGSHVFRQLDGTTWGAREARTQLLQKHVSANLVTEQWVNNHYRWIVWQLASQVRSFPELEPNIWHKDAAFDKLVYRYEREINCASRSAIKKIVERDDIPESYMVLCVSQISKELLSDGEGSARSGSDWDFELTDGWYPIKASVDEALQVYIRQRKILVGDKISVCGAQLVRGADPCPVLEATDAVRLKLTVNGTHRARWNVRLGYQRSRHFTVGLRQVLPAGGAVPCVDVIVCRRYVPRFLEKLPEGGSVFRNQKAEEEAYRIWQREHGKALQRAISAVEAEFANVDGSPDGPEEAADWEEEIRGTTDPAERVRLKACQKEAVENAQRCAMERRQALMMDEVNARMETEMPPRDVSKFITFRVCDYPPEGILAHQTREALLTVWNPDEALASRLQEGRRFKIYNLTTSDNTRDTRMSLNLKAQRSTKYIERVAAADRLVNSLYSERVYARVDTLVGTPSAADVDVLVVTIKSSEIRALPQQNTSPRHVVTVLCTDQSKALLVLEVSAGTREAVDFQPFTLLHCHNLEYVYYDRHFHVLKLKETANSDVSRIARTPYEKAQDRLLSDWCKESCAELREMVSSNGELLQDMATYTGAEKSDARARERTHSQLAVEEQNPTARDGEVYDDEIFGNLSLSLPCDDF